MNHEVEATVLLVDGLIERVDFVVPGHVTGDQLGWLTQRFGEHPGLVAEPFVCVAESEAGSGRIGRFGDGPGYRPLVGNTDDEPVGPAQETSQRDRPLFRREDDRFPDRWPRSGRADPLLPPPLPLDEAWPERSRELF